MQAFFNAYNLDLRDDEASYNQIYIGSGLNNEANFVMTGLMVGFTFNFGFFLSTSINHQDSAQVLQSFFKYR